MLQKLFAITCFLLILFMVDSVKLPPFFNKCSRSDPNLNDCVLKNIVESWATFIKGDNYYHIQKMHPLAIESMFIKVDNNLHGNLTNGSIQHFDTFKFKSVNIDLDKQHWEFTYTFDKVTVTGMYRVTGKLFGLPITGSGVFNVSFYGGDYTYRIDYKLNERAGKKHIHIYDSFTTHDNIKLIHFQLRFFHSSIGDILSDALNSNWQDLGNDIQDSVGFALAGLLSTTLNDFFDRVSFDEFFLP